jgi:PhoD-like phosphatase
MGNAKTDAGDTAAQAVGRLIVGHTTDRCARIWVQGSRRYPSVRLVVRPAGQAETDRVMEREGAVLEERDYTACFDFDSLEPSTAYEVSAAFIHRKAGCLLPPSSPRATGVFTTFPCDPRSSEPFSFLLGSCNLAVVAINNLAAQALELVGFYLAERSLDRPIPERRPPPAPGEGRLLRLCRCLMRQRWARRLLGYVIHGSLRLVFLGTGGKWANQPLLRSPFLKLLGIFAGHRVDFRNGRRAPLAGQTLIGSASREVGVLAFDPVVERGSWDKGDAKGFMILTETAGGFQAGEGLRAERESDPNNGSTQDDAIAYVRASTILEIADLPPPAFTIHCGDQIYYDFPMRDREPQLDSYRDSYRENWFEDRFQRSFLARGSHYMTLDDHELVDQFANDIVLPQPKSTDRAPSAGTSDAPEPKHFPPTQYRDAACPAYQAYVHSRQPDGPFYYDFRYGAARFFVMDTRTCRRRDRGSQMIGREQMSAFKAWLKTDTRDLKFVVSSVPFVAEVLRSKDDPPDVRGRSDDKWCGGSFRWQRDEIIDFIDKEQIERLVFLVGDMHCAYYASMSIGNCHRWARPTVHELAGGPINQLEFGRREQFAPVTSLTTRLRGIPYEIRLHQFHGDASAVMHIQVTSVLDPRDPEGTDEVPEIVWRVVRTMTDPEAVPDPDREKSRCHARRVARIMDHPPISGRITLGRRNGVDQLLPW